MVSLCDIRSHCYLFPLFVMVEEHNLALSMYSIAVSGVCLVTGTMRLEMHLVTLLL